MFAGIGQDDKNLNSEASEEDEDAASEEDEEQTVFPDLRNFGKNLIRSYLKLSTAIYKQMESNANRIDFKCFGRTAQA
jgi:hypothetical protein